MRQSYQILILCFAIIIALLLYTVSESHNRNHLAHSAWEKYEQSFSKLNHISVMLNQMRTLTRLYLATITTMDSFELDELVIRTSTARSTYIKHYQELEKLNLDNTEKNYLKRISEYAGKIRLAQLSYDELLINDAPLNLRLKQAIDTIITPQNKTQEMMQDFLNHIRTKTISDSDIYHKHEDTGRKNINNLQLTTIYLTIFLGIFSVFIVFKGQKTIHDKNHALSRAQSFLHSTLNSTPVALLITDKTGQIIMANNIAVTLFQYSREKLLNMNVNDLIPDKFKQSHVQHILDYANNPTNRSMFADLELIARRQSGDIFPVEVGLNPVDGQDELYIACSIKDISQQKAMEKEILDNKNKAEQANLAKSEFLANVSHELRTPLHAILSFSRLGQKNAHQTQDTAQLSQKLEGYFEKIHISGDKLLGFINELLDFAKLESGKMELDFVEHDIGQLVELFHNEQEARLNELKLNLSVTVSSYNQHAQFDEHHIGQAINNLIANAIKYSPPGGHINISIIADKLNNEEAIRFTIQDEGAGIPEDQLETIFEKYVQSSNTISGGTGLGLSLSKQIVLAHDGMIWAENIDNSNEKEPKRAQKGAKFSFVIPVIHTDTMMP